jgi:glutathione S-transferase
MAERPTLYVCHGDEKGAPMHPCGKVQKALKEAGIEYEKVVAAHGNPLPFLRKGSREELKQATGTDKLPTLKLADGTVLSHSKDILAWVRKERAGHAA